jgi:hypothetical protein
MLFSLDSSFIAIRASACAVAGERCHATARVRDRLSNRKACCISVKGLCEFDRAMSGMEVPDHGAGFHIEGAQQRTWCRVGGRTATIR